MAVRAPNVQGEPNLPQQYYFRFATGLRASRYGCASLGDKNMVNTGVLAIYLLPKMVQKGAAKRCNLDIRRSTAVCGDLCAKSALVVFRLARGFAISHFHPRWRFLAHQPQLLSAKLGEFALRYLRSHPAKLGAV